MRRPLVLGHRGAPRSAPENTIEAFVAAREQGADGVELDVHLSADRRLVVHHDHDVGGLGPIAALRLEDIRAARPEVPTLEEVLAAVGDLFCNVEIKPPPHEDGDERARPGVADMTVAVLRRWARWESVLVSSFDLGILERVRALEPRLGTGYLTVLDPPPLAAVETARRGGHRAIHPFAGALGSETAPGVCAAAAAVGVVVNTWTVNDPEEARRLAAAGVHAIITDVPYTIRQALELP